MKNQPHVSIKPEAIGKAVKNAMDAQMSKLLDGIVTTFHERLSQATKRYGQKATKSDD